VIRAAKFSLRLCSFHKDTILQENEDSDEDWAGKFEDACGEAADDSSRDLFDETPGLSDYGDNHWAADTKDVVNRVSRLLGFIK
jgi:hypothetical protein